MGQSVLQDWVSSLTLREQGALLTAVRGCDVAPKYPLDSPERQLTAFVRWSFMVPADPREVDSEPGCFMQSRITPFKPSALGHYPLHWYTHVMHALQIVAYRHPEHEVRWASLKLYLLLVESLHLKPEDDPNMTARLSEDRIAKGTVVS